MTFLEIVGICIVAYLGVYGIVSRICECIEICHGAKNNKQEENQNG